MVYSISFPKPIDAGFAMGFGTLLAVGGAFPYVEKVKRAGDFGDETVKVAEVGIEGGGARPLPSMIDLGTLGRPRPAVPYEGSAMFSELLDSSPRMLKLSSLPLIDGTGKRADVFIDAAKEDDASVGELIGRYKGTPEGLELARLAFKYSEAAVFLDGLKDETDGTRRSLGDVRKFLDQISPRALEAANRAYEASRSDAPPHFHYAKHCLLLIAGALAATYRYADCSQYAMDALTKAGDFFESHDEHIGDGEGLLVKASALEVLAEMLAVHRLPGMDVGYVYSQQLLPKAMELWMGHLERYPLGPDFDGIYLRALNIAQQGPDHKALEKLFLAKFERQDTPLGSAQFLLRAAWAVLQNEPARRLEADRWKEAEALVHRAERFLGDPEIRGDGSVADLARDVRVQMERFAEESERMMV